VRNANDGVISLQIIDGGLNNISKMLDRLKTLATQSAADQTLEGSSKPRRPTRDQQTLRPTCFA
jgi:flagellin-like hook-associated protein FlgL